MAFAPRGSRPKTTNLTDNLSEERRNKQPEQNARVPTLLGATSPVETARTRERVSRKPPLPRGLAKTAPASRQKAAPAVASSNTDRGNRSASPTKRTKPISRAVVNHSRVKINVQSKPSLKPRLPSRPVASGAQSHVAPDALTICAQLVPWIFMRSSLEARLKPLEERFEEKVQLETDRLNRLEKERESEKQKMELKTEVDILEDLSRAENHSFTSQLITILKEAQSFFSDSEGPQSIATATSKLVSLQDKVHSEEWDPQTFEEIGTELAESINQATALRSSVLALSSQLKDPQLGSSLKTFALWENASQQLLRLLQTRIDSLQELSDAIPLVEAYQRARIELEVLKIGIP
ncbi:hypothetical protein FRC20_000317 [Serendipita sp. 405]|nr:hypothetical protein FRC15_011850 [Serendipita sp. 397]KAG8870143.1 hypothetical protein FRC20_000317 [Serendipita sp. 405]